MTNSTLGLLAGLLLAIAITTGGWFGLVIGVVLGAVGYLVGGARDGEIDLGSLLRGRDRG